MDIVPGKEHHNSNMSPCMMNSTSEKFIIDENLESKLAELPLSDDIKKFYQKFSSSTQEILIGIWTFFSIENLIQMTNNYRQKNVQSIDIAFQYLGMGHVRVAFYHPFYESILYRNDGGSNAYEREANFNNLKNMNTDEFKNGISFEKFLEEVFNQKNDI